MKHIKKALSLLLALALSLTACGKGRDITKGDAPGPEALSGQVQYGYSLKYSPLPAGLVGAYFQCTDGSSIYLSGSSEIIQADSQGQMLNVLKSHSLNGMAAGPEGFTVCLYEFTDGQDLMSVKRLTDPAAFTFHSIVAYDLGETDIDLRGFGYTPEGELLLSLDDAIVYADAGTESPRVLCSFYEEGVAENFFGLRGNPIFPWSGGYLLSQYGDEIICLEYGEIHEKTPLILWGGNTDYNVLDAYVRRFNMTSPDYVVRVSPVKEDEASVAIASGQGPDLYAFSGSGFMGYSDTAVSSGSENKEGAWAFLDFLLSAPQPEEQRLFSALAPVMDVQLEMAASGKFAYGENILPKDVENFQALLSSIHAVVDRYPELMQILTEEAQRFFAGDRSAQEAAATQSRASILMAERYG